MNREYQADLDFQGLTMSDPVSMSSTYFLILKAWSVLNLFISLNLEIQCPLQSKFVEYNDCKKSLSSGSPVIVCDVHTALK